MVLSLRFLQLFSLALACATNASAATFAVVNLADSGPGSLRQAIDAANASPGADDVVFDVGLAGAVELASPLPTVTESLQIEGTGADVLTIDANGLGRVLILWGPSGSLFSVRDLTLTGGLSGGDSGGGVLLYDDQELLLERVRLVGNEASDGVQYFWGGGLFASSDTIVTLRETTIESNRASHGGGVFHLGGTLLVDRSTIAWNTALYEGGGVWSANGSAGFAESTVAFNRASGPAVSFGGGIHVHNAGFLTMYQSTVSGNRADSGPGVRLFGTGTADIVAGSIIAGNRFLGTGNEGNCAVGLGSMNSVDQHNLSGDASCGFTGASDQENTDPELQGLARAGGPTPVLVPTSASPAVEASSGDFCLSIDQRGWFRPVDGDASGGAECDLGAVELNPAAEILIAARGFEFGDPLGRWSVVVGD
jgi:hypothetical protein